MKFSFFIFLYIIVKFKQNITYSNSFVERMSNLLNNIIQKFNPKSIIKKKTKKNLLIGAFKNYKWGVVSPFFKSFERAGFENCDCIMFFDNVPSDTLNKIKSCGVQLYPIPDKFKNMNIINYRWKIYEDFLNEYQNNYNLVFTADIKDVFFQRDIFKIYENKKNFLGVSLEDAIFSQSISNKIWFLNGYGRELYKTIEKERVICVGTIWGTPDKFLEFSKKMWEKLNSEWYINHHIIEQAVTNYLIYIEKMFVNCLATSSNNDGFVMTIGLTKRNNITLDSDNNILNGKGDIAAVIHQYNRKPDIIIKIRKKYCIEFKNKTINKYISKREKITNYNPIINKNIINKSSNHNYMDRGWQYFINIFIFSIILILLIIIIYLFKYHFCSYFQIKKSNNLDTNNSLDIINNIY